MEQPGPEVLGNVMPGYFGSTVRTIPLDKDQVVIPVTVHPAGALTLRVIADEGWDPGPGSGSRQRGLTTGTQAPWTWDQESRARDPGPNGLWSFKLSLKITA